MRKRLSHAEDGQALIEFALTLPLLLLLTFGTIEVAFYLQQQSALNGAAYFAARAGAVTANDRATVGKSLAAYTASADWLGEAGRGLRADPSAGRSRYTLTAKSSRLTGVIAAFATGASGSFDTLSAQATLPMEYDARKFKVSFPLGKGQTASRAEYASQMPKIGLFEGGKAKAFVATTQQLSKAPGLGGLAQIGEVFSARGAVRPNPNARNIKGGDDRQRVTSADYVQPGYEADTFKERAQKLSDIQEKLGPEKGYMGKLKPGLFQAASKLGAPAKPAPGGKAPVPGPGLALKPVVDKLVGPLTTQAASEYKSLSNNEKRLF